VEIDNLARFPPGQDFDEVFIRLKTLREEGWFREIGVCDLNVESLERASKVSSWTSHTRSSKVRSWISR